MSDREIRKARQFGETWHTNPGIMLQNRELTPDEARAALERVKKKYPGLRAYMQGLRIRRPHDQES